MYSIATVLIPCIALGFFFIAFPRIPLTIEQDRPTPIPNITTNSSASDPLAYTDSGEVEGFTHVLSDGSEADIFLGIPYARPPRPVSVGKWSNRLHAKQFGPACVPHVRDPLVGVGIPVSEDCLTLNVFRPHAQSSQYGGYPVLVFIHPGGYQIGSALMFGYVNISDHFVSRGIIVITLQYRLGPLGFASTGNSVMPGNLGLWDQTEALKWLHENIAHFGGNPERITAWGMSAGASSVGQLTLSPLSRDLFSQAIVMSGSHLAGWSTSTNVPDATNELAKTLGCPASDPRTLKKCFKSKNFEEFIQAVEKTGAVDREIAFGKFVPRIDGEFIPQDYEELLHFAPPKPTVMGFTEHESIFFALMGASPSISGLLVMPDQYGAFDNDKLVGSVRDVFASEAKLGSKAEAVRKELIRFYAERNVPSNPDYSFYLTKYTEIQSDIQFILPALLDAQERARAGWPTYLYVNSHFNEKHFPEGFPAKGCVHASEFIPLFGLSFAPVELDDRDRQHQRLLVETFANFIKTGNPSTDDIYWPPLTVSFPSRHLSLTATPTVNETFNEQLVSFWSSLFDKYGTDILHYAPPSKKKRKDEL